MSSDGTLNELEDLDPKRSTDLAIEEARRPIVVARHRALMVSMESLVSDEEIRALAAGMSPDELRSDERVRRLADDDLAHTLALQETVIQYLCMAKEYQQTDDFTGLAMEFYARILCLLEDHQGQKVALDDLRTLATGRIARMLAPLEVKFASRRLADSLVLCQSQIKSALSAVAVINRARGADDDWTEADGDPLLSREAEEPLQNLPEEERRIARRRLVADRVRSAFYRRVFVAYMDRDGIDESELSAHPTILSWLESMRDTPHLYPFLQGQTQGQKIFRIRNLWRKILQINEMYQRVAHASDHPTYRDRFQSLDSRGRLALMAKDHYPPLQVDDAFVVATACCPFRALVTWVQERIEQKDFVLPPEPRAAG